jgi:ACS family tartrate transporter-like MFS transporter
LGAGLFFIGYFFFEVPSNLALVRFGARRWIARIMFTWAILSAATAFVTGAYGFYFVRIVLGVAEAVFFPGVILFARRRVCRKLRMACFPSWPWR